MGKPINSKILSIVRSIPPRSERVTEPEEALMRDDDPLRVWVVCFELASADLVLLMVEGVV